MRINILFLFTILFFISCENEDDNSSEISNSQITNPEWNINLGRDTDIPFFPDGKSNYFTYAFQREVTDNSIIKISGEFPNARYFSIIIYDNDTRNPIVILRDIEISPKNNNQNPFLIQQYTSDQLYEIFIGSTNSDLNTFSNNIIYDSEVTNLSIFIRYYLPEINDFGGVELPTISAIDELNNLVQAPEPEELEDLVNVNSIISNLQLLGNALFSNESDNDRFFFRANGDNSGNFSNPDNAYLISANTLVNDNVILLRWRAPLVSENFGDFNQDDMRYLSVSLSDESSFNYRTQSDSELYVASDGYINLVIARNDQEIIDNSNGLNYMEWPEEMEESGYILYRNMLTSENFQNGISQCTTISGNYLDFISSPEAYDASNFINEFAPSGLVMSKDEFLDNFGGIEVSY